MEKFAVDLEKVLNDFEYSEEQLNEYSSEDRTVNNSYNCNYKIYQRQYRPPAANYRRPPFEPVNLADADFSISPRASSTQIQSDYIAECSDSRVRFTELEKPKIQEIANEIKIDEIPKLENYLFPKSKEFIPDLIESNTDIASNLDEFSRVERHLPDIASADVEIKDEIVNFDLINDSVDREVETQTKDSNQEIIRFQILPDVPENELHQYLEKLEECELSTNNKVNDNNTEPENLKSSVNYDDKLNTLTDLKNNKFNNDESNKIYIKVEPEPKYFEKTIDIQKENIDTQFEENEKKEKEIMEQTTLNPCMYSDNITILNVNDLDIINSSMADEVKTENSPVDITNNVDDLENNDYSENNENTMNLVKENNEDFKTENCVHENKLETEVKNDEPEFKMDDCNIVSSFDLTNTCAENFSCDCPATDNVAEYVQKTEEKTTEVREIRAKDEVKTDEMENEDIRRKQMNKVCNVSIHGQVMDELKIENTNDLPVTCDLNYQVVDSETVVNTFESTTENLVKPETSKNENNNSSNMKTEKEINSQPPKLQRPDSLNLIHTTQTLEMSSTSADSGSLISVEERKLGKEQPFWIPDSETTVCMHCQMKFTLVRRRHHCRACGLVLCSKCCDMKASLEYLGYEEVRVCHTCHNILEKVNNFEVEISSIKRPNPNNPMEYCSTIPPLLQVGLAQTSPPSVLVPVLKREGRIKNNDTPKQVIFSDGIRPGGDLTELDIPSEPRLPLRRYPRLTKRVGTPPGNLATHKRMLNPETRSFIPSNNDLPPLVTKIQGEYTFFEIEKALTADDEPAKFAVNRNLFVIVKRIVLDCCVNRDVWCMTTEGLSCVGQDEIVFIIEVLPEEKYPPKDVFLTVNFLYQEASKGTTVTEMSFSSPYLSQLFSSKEHGGFVFIRPTYQCIQKLVLPKAPYLVALLVHRWETPWARLFPIRLILRLGAEFRYYPCPLVSVRNRAALFTDIGHTIISLLADFRKYSYSLPTVRGLLIHMEDRLTTILLPTNRYDQVIRAMNNSEENVLAFAGNISTTADSHLVCIQSTQDDTSYTTQAINIHNKPRQVTGASFIVFNGSLKQCAWAGKSNIVEDGLMVQIPSESMSNLRTALKQMKDYTIGCGPQAEEVVLLKWTADDVNFNIGVKSNIDNKPLDGIPSIRVHNGTDYSGSTRLIRWTEVFILQSDEDSGNKTGDMVNISKLSESIARATCVALVPLLDLLVTANLSTLAVRATIHPENVGYEAGSKGEKLPPLYMKSLDETLIAVVHDAAVSIRDISYPIVLELIFKIMEQG